MFGLLVELLCVMIVELGFMFWVGGFAFEVLGWFDLLNLIWV